MFPNCPSTIQYNPQQSIVYSTGTNGTETVQIDLTQKTPGINDCWRIKTGSYSYCGGGGANTRQIYTGFNQQKPDKTPYQMVLDTTDYVRNMYPNNGQQTCIYKPSDDDLKYIGQTNSPQVVFFQKTD